MQHKTKKIWLIALLSLLIVALFAASFTYARYYKETGVTGGKYDDTIEFVGANKYIVYTPEELVAAIENGYSYIEIAEDVEDPFIITDGVTDVSANLVLDINGHNLVRNSRNPLIDVQENVSVVIVYDSKASGSFYNPVGSMLQASGGTLTIATGNFTSGPKAEDYVKDDRRTDKGVSYSLEKYTVYYRDGYTPGATSPNRSAEYIDTGVEADLPKIVPVAIDSEAEDRYGNIYFENGIGSNDYIKDDTFLIYTEETVETPEGATVTVDFSPLCDVASCDFYYYYVTGTDGTGEDKTTTYAVVYGYHDVMKGAEQQITEGGFNDGETLIDADTAVIWPYAAVRMTEGEAFIRGGTYTNQFGKAQSYGIYARGGSLSVQGEKTSFTSVEDGVCIRCTKEGNAAPSLNIENGSFTSYNGDTVWVNGGTMTLASGTFNKTATKSGTQSAVIRMTGGELACSATAHDIVMTCGGAADSAGKESIYSNLYGIYSVGGTVALNNAKITVSGTYSAGILAEYDQDAQQQVQTDKEMVELTNTEITVKNGFASVQNEERSVLSSTAISTRGGTVSFEGGTNIVTSDGIGITASPAVDEHGVIVGADGKPVAVGQVTVVKGETIINADNATGVYVYGGNLQIYGDGILTVNSTILANSVWAGQSSTETVSNYAYQSDGVLIDGGSLKAEGTLNVEFTGVENDAQNETQYNTYLTQQIKSYAVRVEAASGSATQVTIVKGKIINQVKYAEDGKEIGGGGGVYVGGGTVTLGTSGDTTGYSEENKTGLTVETTGTRYSQNGTGEFSGNWNYHWNLTGGDAIKVVDGTLDVNGGKYTSQQGNGILVSSGTANIYDGYFSGKDQYRYGSGFMTGPGSSYAFKLYGGKLTIFDGEFRSEGGGAFVMGKSADNTGTANIYGGIIEAKGATAVATWQYAEVLFNNEGAIAGAPDGYPTTRDLYVSGASTGITLEANTTSEFSVTVQGSGTFTGGVYSNANANIDIAENNMTPGSNRDGIWYGNSSASLAVFGGTFQGDNRSGLYFGAAPNRNNVQLSGGMFTGNSAINAVNPREITTGNILANNAWCFSRVPTSDWDTDGAICTYEYNHDWGQTYKYTQVGQGNSVRLNESGRGWGLYSFYIQGTNGSPRALNEYETVVIRTGTQITFDR